MRQANETHQTIQRSDHEINSLLFMASGSEWEVEGQL